MPLALAILSCALVAGTCHATGPGVRAYALRVSAPAGSVVRLRALEVPRGWTASFCTARVCSPRRIALTLRGSRETIQLSYAQTAEQAAPLRVLRVAGRSGTGDAVARSAVR